MKKKKPTLAAVRRAASKASDAAGRWTRDRQAAHLAAFQEVRRMQSGELSNLLHNAATDYDDRAGDLTGHDDALPDLMRAAACRFAGAQIAAAAAQRVALIMAVNELRRLAAAADPKPRENETRPGPYRLSLIADELNDVAAKLPRLS